MLVRTVVLDPETWRLLRLMSRNHASRSAVIRDAIRLLASLGGFAPTASVDTILQRWEILPATLEALADWLKMEGKNERLD